jgi:hydroxymethylpyrimidine/phosphomethylpyrimidine kinase
MIPNILSIAGTDPTGGAGIQADIKSIAANGGYGMAVISCLVAQNSNGVSEIHTPPTEFLWRQLRAVSEDVRVDAVKIGMLGNAANIETVISWLDEIKPPITVLDPVMKASSGGNLLSEGGITPLRSLIEKVDLVTPNLPELAALLGKDEASNWSQAITQAVRLSQSFQTIVLLKGGHIASDEAKDALIDARSRLEHEIKLVEKSTKRVNTSNTHGTGCSLSSAIATRQAINLDWERSFTEAKSWLQKSIEGAHLLDVGRKAGPINHFYDHSEIVGRAERS